MAFSSLIFLFLFLPLVLTMYLLAGAKLRNLTLMLASLFFYAWGEGIYVLVMLYCITVSWTVGVLLINQRQDFKRKRLLWTGVALVLLPLASFKYLAFVVGNLALLGFNVDPAALHQAAIHLPIGISFFTFQALSYLVDVYRGHTAAQKSVLNLALYISLFPQLVAGPIVRYKDISSQIVRRVTSLPLFASGVERFIYGLGKKVLIANPLGAIADIAFALPAEELGFVTAWIGLICFALQIYFDFSGYSDMAIGLGRMFGFRFLENFNYPYIAKSLREFWRRWHISLSTWFRDYVYFSLGGSRGSGPKVARNLLLVFFLCGLWHGASWNFIVWGMIHGIFLVMERGRFGALLDRLPLVFQHLYLLSVVLIAWVFFRADDLGHSMAFLSELFEFSGSVAITVPMFIKMDLQFYFALLVGLVFSTPLRTTLSTRALQLAEQIAKEFATPLGQGLKLLVMMAILLPSIFELAVGSYNPFIYFRF